MTRSGRALATAPGGGTRPIPRDWGRRLFGRHAAVYDRVRPGYPEGVYRQLEQTCGLGPGAAVFEIGPGTGKASHELLRRGARPLVLIEPDRRMLRFLRGALAEWSDRVQFVARPFEDAELTPGSFDLGVAATSFHWLRQGTSLRKVARLLRPGGWWAVWWSLTGDPMRPTAFSRAVDPMFRALERRRASRVPERVAFARGRARRLAALRATGRFDRIRCRTIRWERSLDTAALVELYGTFGVIQVQTPARRRRFLGDLAQLVDEQFGGRVVLRVVVTLYTARRKPDRPTRRSLKRARSRTDRRPQPNPGASPSARRTALARSTPPWRGSS